MELLSEVWHHKKDLKGIAGENNFTTLALCLQPSAKSDASCQQCLEGNKKIGGHRAWLGVLSLTSWAVPFVTSLWGYFQDFVAWTFHGNHGKVRRQPAGP